MNFSFLLNSYGLGIEACDKHQYKVGEYNFIWEIQKDIMNDMGECSIIDV